MQEPIPWTLQYKCKFCGTESYYQGPRQKENHVCSTCGRKEMRMIKCNFCGGQGALIRETEMSTCYFSMRAHVDCVGHSQYRPVSQDEYDLCKDYYAEKKKEQ